MAFPRNVQTVRHFPMIHVKIYRIKLRPLSAPTLLPFSPSVHYVDVNNLAQDSRIQLLTTGYDLCYKSPKICVGE